MFSVIGKDGKCRVDNAKLEAYNQMAYLRLIGRRADLKVENGEYTVSSPGLLAITFTEEVAK
jgi:hypothetical protein